MTERKAWITVGLPYCGKEIWARAMTSCHTRTLSQILVAREMCEEIAAPPHFDFWNSDLYRQLNARWEERLQFLIYKKHNIVVADENLYKNSRVNLVERLKDEGYTVTYVLFDVSADEAKLRNLERNSFVIPLHEFDKLIPLFNQTKKDLPNEAAELDVKLITVKTINIHKLREQGVSTKVLGFGDTVQETDFQVYANCSSVAGITFSPPVECWIGCKLIPFPHPTFIRIVETK